MLLMYDVFKNELFIELLQKNRKQNESCELRRANFKTKAMNTLKNGKYFYNFLNCSFIKIIMLITLSDQLLQVAIDPITYVVAEA